MLGHVGRGGVVRRAYSSYLMRRRFAQLHWPLHYCTCGEMQMAAEVGVTYYRFDPLCENDFVFSPGGENIVPQIRGVFRKIFIVLIRREN
jgi:hypothetical protein